MGYACVLMIFCFAAVAFAQPNVREATTCGNEQEISLHCGAAEQIKIKTAVYGRLTSDICNGFLVPILTNKCKAANSELVARQACDGKQRCNLKASASNFGDPCFGTAKYLQVTYECEPKNSDLITTTTCENQKVALQCGAGKMISIKDAFYGRVSREVCNGFGTLILTTNCKAGNAEAVVKGACDGKQSCSLEASTGKFGDPCFGTNKYMRVQHECVPKPVATSAPTAVPEENGYIKATACQNEKVTLQCGAEEVVSIKSGFYGRVSRDACNGFGTLILTTNCKAGNAEAVIKGACDGKQSCSLVASDAQFGDPCFGTNKYMQVEYECVPKPVEVVQDIVGIESAVVCEGKTLALSCAADKELVIYYAVYGRQSPRICSTGIFGLLQNNKCGSIASQGVVEKECNGKQSCTLTASASKFGDPCFGTNKYLHVNYECVAKSANISPPPMEIGLNCEGKPVDISCKYNEKINVHYAMYGRRTRNICNEGPIITTECRMPNSLETARAMCDGKRECSVEAAVAHFGEPCVGTTKYLQIMYTCVPEPVECPREEGFCVLPTGADQNVGVIKLNNKNQNNEALRAQCLDLCQKTPGATGCEVIWDQLFNAGCYVHTQPITQGNGVGNHQCWVFSKCNSFVPPTVAVSPPTASPTIECPREEGFCVLPTGADQNVGVIKLNNKNQNNEALRAQCLDLCQKTPGATGCEVIWDQLFNAGCYVHTQPITQGNGVGNHQCWVFSKCNSFVPPTVAVSAPTASPTIECPREEGFCVLPTGADQNVGVIKLNNKNQNNEALRAQCLDLCQKTPGATGCEVIWDQLFNAGCYVHTQPITQGNGVGNHQCWVFSKCNSFVPPTVAVSAPTASPTIECPREEGFCVLPTGADQNVGVIKLNNKNQNNEALRAQCLDLCQKTPWATGCEVIWDQLFNAGCYVHTQPITQGNGVGNHQCWVFSKCNSFVPPTVAVVPPTVSPTTPIPPISTVRGLAFACEGQQMTLQCKPTEEIFIMYANYGRTAKDVCPGGPIRTLACGQPISASVVRNLCHGKEKCTVTASSDQFNDPCFGTSKYLEVKYRCVERIAENFHTLPSGNAVCMNKKNFAFPIQNGVGEMDMQDRTITWCNTAGRPGPFQSLGFQGKEFAGKLISLSFSIKFIGQVPPPSYGFGIKIFGRLYNGWTRSCSADAWCCVKLFSRVGLAGDNYNIKLMFDSVEGKQSVQIKNLKVELPEKIEQSFDAFNGPAIMMNHKPFLPITSTGLMYPAKPENTIGGKLNFITWENVIGKPSIFQWLGWKSTSLFANKILRVSFFIKFEGRVPEAEGNLGIKVFGVIYNDWVKGCKADDWCYVEKTITNKAEGDNGHVLLIFDEIAYKGKVHIGDLKVDILKPKKVCPFAASGMNFLNPLNPLAIAVEAHKTALGLGTKIFADGLGLGLGLGKAALGLGLGAGQIGLGLGAGAGKAALGLGLGAGKAALGLGLGAGKAVLDAKVGAGKAALGLGLGAGKAALGLGLGAGKVGLGLGLGAGKVGLGLGLGAGKAALGLGLGAGKAVLVAKVGAGKAALGLGLGAGKAVLGLGLGAGRVGLGLGLGAGKVGLGLGLGAGKAALGLGLGAGKAVLDAKVGAGKAALGLGLGAGKVGLGLGLGAGKVGLGLGLGAGKVGLGLGLGAGKAALGLGLGAGKVGLGLGLGAGKAVLDAKVGAGKAALGLGLGAGKVGLGLGLGAGKAVLGHGTEMVADAATGLVQFSKPIGAFPSVALGWQNNLFANRQVKIKCWLKFPLAVPKVTAKVGAGKVGLGLGLGAGKVGLGLGLGAGKAALGLGLGAGKAVLDAKVGAGKAALGLGLGAGKAVLGFGLGAGKAALGLGLGAGKAVLDAKVGAGKAALGLGLGAGEAALGLGLGAGKAALGLGLGAGKAVLDAKVGAGKAALGLGLGAGKAALGLGLGAGKAALGLGLGAGKAVLDAKVGAGKAALGLGLGAAKAALGLGLGAGKAGLELGLGAGKAVGFGLNVYGQVFNTFVEGCTPGKWCYVEQNMKCGGSNSNNFNKIGLSFGSLVQPIALEVKGFDMEVF